MARNRQKARLQNTCRYAFQLFSAVLHITGFCRPAVFHSQYHAVGLITSFAISRIFSGRNLTTDVCIACPTMSAQPVQSATSPSQRAKMSARRRIVGAYGPGREHPMPRFEYRTQANEGREQSRRNTPSRRCHFPIRIATRAHRALTRRRHHVVDKADENQLGIFSI